MAVGGVLFVGVRVVVGLEMVDQRHEWVEFVG